MGPKLFFDVDGTLVRFGGFKGPPIDHSVEIGYAVAPSRQGTGVATAATRELSSRARTAGVRVVVAHTLAESSASTSVLERCGFAQIATTSDPDDPDGPAVWRWEARLG